MITLLHTADWHLGATLQGWSREAEHRAALDQLVEMAREREVDAVIVAGDIFDGLNPSGEAQALLYNALRRLREARPAASIALIAGNHDPALRLEAPRPLFDLAGVASIGVIARNAGAPDLDAHLKPIKDKDGRIGAYLLALPYPRAADLPFVEDAEGSRIVAQLRALYAEFIGAARKTIGDAPLVVTGHLHVAGGLESEGAERRIIIGGEHAAPVDLFCGDPAYVALGHLHRPQSVGRETIRYSGSLIPMSKTEIGYRHGASLVTIGAGGRAEIEALAFDRSVPHLRIPREGALAPSEVEAAFAALNLPASLPPDARPFIHLVVRVDGPAVGLRADIDAMAEKFPLRLVSLAIERPQATPIAPLADPAMRLSERKPEELFRDAFGRAHRVPPGEEHIALFQSLLREEE